MLVDLNQAWTVKAPYWPSFRSGRDPYAGEDVELTMALPGLSEMETMGGEE